MSKIDDLVAQVLEVECEVDADIQSAESRSQDVKRQSDKKEREIVAIARDVAKNKCDELERENSVKIEDFMKAVHSEGEKKAKQLEMSCKECIGVIARDIVDEIINETV